MKQAIAVTLTSLVFAGLTGLASNAGAAGKRIDTSACFKTTTYTASSGKRYRVKMPKGQACFDNRLGIQGGAHIARADGGDNPLGAINAARSMNRRNVVFVVRGTCESSCWIQWNFMKNKCWAGNSAPTFRQHATTASGRKINPHSKSRSYWIQAGREGPGHDWTAWKPSAKYRCTETDMNMRSTSARTGGTGRDSFRHDRGRTPGLFYVRGGR
ncbi:MAG: hypothetical protein AAF299_08520 [Pseudomonadota bacterium]